MTTARFIYTDRPISKSEYFLEDIIGEDQEVIIQLDGSPSVGISLDEPCEVDRKAAGHLFPGLIIYRMDSVLSFNYNSKYQLDYMRERGQKALKWLLDIAREHLKNGAKKFYYGVLNESLNPDKKKPKMRKLDLAEFKPNEKKFDFGDYVIWEFIDSSIKP
jgi:hypothetical protein